jgi:hypothetical protein
MQTFVRLADRVGHFQLRLAENNFKQGFEDETKLVAPLWSFGDWQRPSAQYRAAHINTERAKSTYRPVINNGKAQTSTLTFRQHFNRTKPLQYTALADWRGILTEHACQLIAIR